MSSENEIDDQDWNKLVGRIRRQRCTPFLGAGASYPYLPLGAQVATAWADKYGYPFADRNNLVGVAQYLAVDSDPMTPKEDILDVVAAAAERPDFKQAGQPHGVLAKLPIPIYVTTNYDSYMSDALKQQNRDVRQECCRWNDSLTNRPSTFDDGYVPTVANPVVYHLHGHGTPETVVITEDDYLEFLANMARRSLLPDAIESALRNNTCVFLGYGLADWNFRILFQALRSRLSGFNVISIYPPSDVAQHAKLQRYYARQYSSINARIFWGSAADFCRELERRWTATA